MRFITKVLSAVATTAATVEAFITINRWLKKKEEDEWTKAQMYEAERLALPTLAETLSTKDAVCMKVKNKSQSLLHNPQVYSASGLIKGSVPLTVEPGTYRCLAIEKTSSYYYRGITGVITYDIGDTKNRMCIFYYNPYFGYNGFGLHWDEDTRTVDEGFFKLMQSQNEIWSPKGTVTWHTKSTNDYDLSGFISQGDPAYLHIVLEDK